MHKIEYLLGDYNNCVIVLYTQTFTLRYYSTDGSVRLGYGIKHRYPSFDSDEKKRFKSEMENILDVKINKIIINYSVKHHDYERII